MNYIILCSGRGDRVVYGGGLVVPPGILSDDFVPSCCAPAILYLGMLLKGEIGCGEATIDIEAKINLIDRRVQNGGNR
jgi:hypothetical protein